MQNNQKDNSLNILELQDEESEGPPQRQFQSGDEFDLADASQPKVEAISDSQLLPKDATSDKDSLNDLDDMERQLEAEIKKRDESFSIDRTSYEDQASSKVEKGNSQDRINLLEDTNEKMSDDEEAKDSNNVRQSSEAQSSTFQQSYQKGSVNPRESSSGNGLADQAKSSFYLSVHKAGLDGVDKEKVHEIISNASKGSKYYNQEEQKLKEVKEKVDAYMLKVEGVKKNQRQYKSIAAEVDARIAEARLELEVDRTWIHVDMDAFYAAVEIRDDPSLADKPLAIGDKNMILTTNYVARKHGVRSGVPGFIGQKLCKDLIFMKANYPKYRAASEEFHSVLRKYDQQLEGVGLDEANLDVTEYLKLNNMDTEIGRGFLAEQIRREIKQATKMTASCGIAPNKMLAKICSDYKKPDGQTQLENDVKKIGEFMDNLLVRKLPGVGKVNEQILAGMGIVKCPDAIRLATHIYINFTVNAFDFMIRACMGIAKNVHEDQGVKKSLNISETIPVTSSYNEIKRKMEQLCEELAARAQSQKLKGRTLTVEFKNDKFKNKQKSYTDSIFTDDKEKITQVALSLLDSAWPLDPTRQISVKLLNLKDEHGRTSVSAHNIAAQTGGRTKLGGNPKVDQPKQFVKKATAFRGVQLGPPPDKFTHSAMGDHPTAHQEEPLFEQTMNPEEQFFEPPPRPSCGPSRLGRIGPQSMPKRGPPRIQHNVPPQEFASYQDEAEYRRKQQEYLVSKFKYQNFLKKKAKEKDQRRNEQMATGQAQPQQQGSYRDKFRSGIKSQVEARQQERQQAKNDEMRTYRNFYRNNKFHYGRGPPSGRGGIAGAGAGRGASQAQPARVDTNQKSLSSFLKK